MIIKAFTPLLVAAFAGSAALALPTIVDIATGDDTFSNLVAAVVATGLLPALQGDGPLTVFAPTNDAFSSVPAKFINDDNYLPHLTAIILYHVLGAEVFSNQLSHGLEAETLSGETVTVTNLHPLTINQSKVITADVDASNGVVHVVDSVLLPTAATKSVYRFAQETPSLSSFVSAVFAAVFEMSLDNIHLSYTVFAPTNEAFAKLGSETLEILFLPDNRDLLVDLLKYHFIVYDVITAHEIGNGPIGPQHLEVTNQHPLTIEQAVVVGPDNLVNNGVVHIIDAVLIPDGFMVPTKPPPVSRSIVDVFIGDDDFSILESALVATGLLPALQGDGPLTLFAPLNDAFSNVPTKFVSDDNYLPHLAAILLYHVLGAKVFTNRLTPGLQLETLLGESVKVTKRSPLTINQSRVSPGDIDAKNGVVHVIHDSVLLPTAATKTIVDLASATDSLSTLVNAVVAADLAGTLSDSTGSFTVFAPTNDAFAKLDVETLEALLLPENKNLLVELLLYHVVVGDVITADEIGSGPIGPQQLEVTNTHPVTIEQSVVVATDILANNGVVHLIDAVLIPEGFTVPSEPSMPSIVEIASGDDTFSTLVSAVVATGLLPALQGDGPLTVFAPTNDAFSNVPAKFVNDDNYLPHLTAILLYHVLGAEVFSNQLSQGLEVETLSGESIKVTNLSPITINQSKVITADVDASNGVVHVIDSVLLPTAATKTIVDLASATDSLSTLVSAVVAADLAGTLSDSTGSFTVFAPTNDAFAKLDAETLEALLLPENKDLLVELLLYHVVVGDVITADEIGSGHIGPQQLEVTNTHPVTIEQSVVVATDVLANNGVVHLIDAVLIPDGFTVPSEPSMPSIVEIASGDDTFSTLVSAVVATGLLPALQGDGPLTVFAPTNDAFSNIPAKFVNDDNYLPHLTAILLYHVLGAEVFSNQLSQGLEVETLSGESIKVTNLSPITINQSKVITADVDASNGVVHVIDSVLLPTAATKTIVDLASATDSLSTLVSAVVAADLAGTLSDSTGSFTVFAPTNDAFAKLDSETLEALLLPENKKLLVELLLYHVVVGDVITADEIGSGPIGPQQLEVTNTHPVTIEQSVVVATDVLANNGVVHLIDAVLIPDGFTVPSEPSMPSIVEIASGDDTFSTLVSAVVATGLLPALQGDGPLTVFAPTNDAFSNVPAKFVNDDNYLPHLTAILLYHVLGAEVFSNQLSQGLEVETLSGESIQVTNLSPITINQSTVITADVDAKNGVVHVIDSVLLPTAATKTIVDLASATDSLSTLVSAVVAADLAGTLSDSTGSFTVFAPTNDAFAKLDAETLEALLLPENKDLLVELLLYHVVVGDVITADEIGSGHIGPQQLKVTIENLLAIENSVVIEADVLANNGVVHLIDTVLIPNGFTVGGSYPDSISLQTAAAETIVDVASNTVSLSTLVSAVVAADLVGTLGNATGSFTVFAPTNEAFAKLDSDTLEALLLPENKDSLVELLLYHVVLDDVITADEIGSGPIGPQQLEVTNVDPLTIEESVVVATDILASNGVVHLIDAVLIPDGFMVPTSNSTSSAWTDFSTKALMASVVFGLMFWW